MHLYLARRESRELCHDLAGLAPLCLATSEFVCSAVVEVGKRNTRKNKKEKRWKVSETCVEIVVCVGEWRVSQWE